ncbi:MAG TPA: hypothetical protein VN026_12375 [Bacteroidia bacterium]|jgi:hypothetical protein|nr:hypothetical protein [Bacteroidia bacterium]
MQKQINTVEELEIELKQIKEDKSKYAKKGLYEWCAKLRDREKQIIAELDVLKTFSL